MTRSVPNSACSPSVTRNCAAESAAGVERRLNRGQFVALAAPTSAPCRNDAVQAASPSVTSAAQFQEMRRGEEDGDQEEKCFQESGSEDLEQEDQRPQGRAVTKPAKKTVKKPVKKVAPQQISRGAPSQRPAWQWSAARRLHRGRDPTGAISAVETVEAHLERMRGRQSRLNAVVVDLSEEALKAAHAAG